MKFQCPARGKEKEEIKRDISFTRAKIGFSLVFKVMGREPRPIFEGRDSLKCVLAINF